MAHEAGTEWQGKRAKNRALGGPSMYGVEKEDSEKMERERYQRSPEEDDNAEANEK